MWKISDLNSIFNWNKLWRDGKIFFPYWETRGNEPKQTDLSVLNVCFYQTLISLNIYAAIGSIGMC